MGGIISTRPLEDLPFAFSSLLRTWRNSKAVRLQMIHQEEIPEEVHQKWYKRVISRQSSYRVRVAFAGDTPFGVIYLTDIDQVAGIASWGMYIGEESFRGRGLGFQMLKEILLWGFKELSLFRMYTSVLEDNKPALKLYRKAGFHVEGIWRKHVFCTDGQRCGLVWVGMLREEWYVLECNLF